MWDDYSHAMLGNIIRDAIDGAYLREQEVHEDQCVGLMDNNIGEKHAPSKHRLMPSSSGAARSSAKIVRGVTIIEFNGEHLTVAQWAERLGVAKNSLEVRLMRGWSVERALTKPFAAPRTGRAVRKPPKISHH